MIWYGFLAVGKEIGDSDESKAFFFAGDSWLYVQRKVMKKRSGVCKRQKTMM